MKKYTTKRLLATLLSVVMPATLLLGGCTSSTQTPQSGVPASQAVSSAAASGTGAHNGTVNLFLVRHGKTIMNTLDLVQGWSDSPLTAAGVNDAQNAAVGMSDIAFDYAYSSDRGRAVETAEIILAANKTAGKLPLVTMPGLRETYFGSFEGEPNQYMWGKIAEYHGVADIQAVMAKVGADNVFSAVPEIDPSGTAETHEEVITRLKNAFSSIVDDVSAKGGGNVLVVGHGASLLTIMGQLTQAENLPAGLKNASVSKLVYKDGKYTLEYADNTEFAEKGAAVRAELEKPVTVYLVRHGKTEFNTAGRVQGWIDSPLTAEGREVATQLGKGLADTQFNRVYTSGMGRAVETAQLVLMENKTSAALPLLKNAGLRETNYGSFEGKLNKEMLQNALDYFGVSSLEQLATKDQSVLERVLYANYVTDETGAAENIFELRARVDNAFKAVVQDASENGGGNILVVSHGNAIMAVLEDLGIKDPGDIKNASVTKIVYQNGEYTVEAVNDLSYVEAGAKA